MSDEDFSLSSNDESINSKTFSGPGKHIYFDNDDDDNDNDKKNSTTQKIIERPTPSTIRIDGSDLISRCKDFLPLLSDIQSNENHLLKKLDHNDDDEFNIPDILSEKSSKESGEVSSTNDDDDDDDKNEKSNEINKKKRKKKKKKKKKKLKINDDLNQDIQKID